MTTDTPLQIDIDANTRARLEKLAAERGAPLGDVGSYAVLLGLKLLESGLDEERAIRALQEPGAGMDIPLLMAKRKSRGQFMTGDEVRERVSGGRCEILWDDKWFNDETFGFEGENEDDA